MYKFNQHINIPGRVYFTNNVASMHYDRTDEAINFRIDDVPILTLSKDGVSAIGIPEAPFDVNVINSIPILITTVQILSTEITGFDSSLQDINGNLLTVLSDDYASTVKSDLTKIGGNDVDIGNGTASTATQRVCIASDNLPITITPSAPITTISTVTNTVNVQTDGLTDKVQTAIDINDITNKGQQLMADSIPVTIASDQSDVGVVLNEVASKFKSNNDSININIMRINDKAAGFFNTGSVTDGTQRVILTDDYLSTSLTQITDINISAQTTDLNVNVTNTSLTTDLDSVGGSSVTLGQKTSANSIPVVIASDQSTYTVTANAGTNLNTSALALESGGNLDTIVTNTGNIDTNTSSIDTKFPSQGQATMAASVPVVIASDQSIYTVTANAGTNLNTSALALESGGNLDTIVTNTGNIDTSTASINTKIPSQGQATMAASLPVVIASNQSEVPINHTQINGNTVSTSNGATGTGVQRVILTDDYLSTVIQKSYIEETLTLNVADFRLNASTNMAQNLTISGAANSTLTTLATGGSSIIYVEKITMTISYSSGTVDSDSWGTASTLLTTGFTIQYIPNSTIGTIKLSGFTNTIRALKDVIRIFDNHELYVWGTGDVFKATLFFPEKLKIDTSDTGTVRYAFANDDLTGGSTLGSFESHLWYWSIPA